MAPKVKDYACFHVTWMESVQEGFWLMSHAICLCWSAPVLYGRSLWRQARITVYGVYRRWMARGRLARLGKSTPRAFTALRYYERREGDRRPNTKTTKDDDVIGRSFANVKRQDLSSAMAQVRIISRAITPATGR